MKKQLLKSTQRVLLLGLLGLAWPALIQAQTDVNALGRTGQPLLIEAAQKRDVSTVRRLLDQGADVQLKDSNGRTALHYASGGKKYTAPGYQTDDDCLPEEFAQYTQIVTMLLEAGAKIETRDNYGFTALMFAAEAQYATNTKLLLQAGAEINALSTNGDSALLLAAQKRRVSNQTVLLAFGASPNIVNQQGGTAFLEASWSGSTPVDIIQLYLRAGANLNQRDSKGLSVLMGVVTSWRFQPEVLEALIAAGADVNSQDKEGKTVLIHAIESDYSAIPAVEILLKAKAKVNVNLQDKNGRNVFFNLAKSRLKVEDIETLVPLLVAAGGNINAVDKDGLISLFLVLNNYDLIQLWLDHGADVTIKDKSGETVLNYFYTSVVIDQFSMMDKKDKEAAFLTFLRRSKVITFPGIDYQPLNWAAGVGNLEMVKILLKNGADPNYHYSLKTADSNVYPILAAASGGHIEIVRLLLDKGAKVNVKGNYYQTTPLMFACEGAYVELVALLLKAKADVNATAKSNFSALELAVSVQSDEIVKMLLAAKANVDIETSMGSPLIIALRNEAIEIVEMLLQAKANVNLRTGREQTTPLLAAIGAGDSRYVNLLIAAKADVNAPALGMPGEPAASDGEYPLTMARRLGYRDIIDALVKAGAKETPPAPVAKVMPTYELFDTGPSGGVIIDVEKPNANGWRYVEALPQPLPDTYGWKSATYNAKGRKPLVSIGQPGNGKINTEAIVKEFGAGTYAAKACSDLVQGGFDDWYLPNSSELSMIGEYLQYIESSVEGQFWASTMNGQKAWQMNFGTGDADFFDAGSKAQVWPVRRF